MPNSVITNHDCSKTMSLALQENFLGRKQRVASRCERSITRAFRGELDDKKRKKFHHQTTVTNLDITASNLATKSFLVLLVLTCLNIGYFGINEVASSSSPTNIEQSFSDSNRLALLSHPSALNQQQTKQQQQQQAFQQAPQNHLQDHQTPVSNFDASNYRSIYEAIRNHPELREFANLCESDAVRGIVSMDKIALTIFAPIDRSLSDLVAKSKSHSINLNELAQHHIAQGFVMPDENTKYPRQFNSYSLLSPLYLNQVVQSSNKQATYFVNNAKILATYLIPIENGAPDTYQTLHVIDQVIEFAYVNRQTQLRSPSNLANVQSMSGKRTTATLKRAFNLDELVAQPEAAYEFYERFSDYQTNQAQVDLYHTRVYKGSQQATQKAVSLSRDDFNLDKLMKLVKQLHSKELKGKLFQVNESNSLSTFFLPINSDDLDSLLESPASQHALTFETLIIPNQVLFTRTMLLGSHHDTLFNQNSNSHRVTLNLAKTLPDQSETDTLHDESQPDLNSNVRNLLATPLLLQSKCLPVTKQQIFNQEQPQSSSFWRPGVTSTEILVANIPLTNGVLHLIKKPIVVSDSTNILDYLNDNDSQLSNVVNSIGSSTSGLINSNLEGNPVKVNKFRELLARERQMLATFSMDQSMNKTIFAPSDEAFSKLRYDLRALVQGDESLIPKHWDTSYRHDLLERLVRRHIVLHQTITSDQMDSVNNQPQILTENGKILTFNRITEPSFDKEAVNEKFQVESDSTQANLLHYDLIGSNGVLHIIDRVLGEEQETVYSLLKSIILKYNYSLEESQVNQNELNQMIQASLKSNRQQSSDTGMISSANSVQSTEANLSQYNSDQDIGKQASNPDFGIISKSIGQYLDDLSSSNRRQLEFLASSVNISYQLARLTSLAEGLDDWNERFKSTERAFTYFVPSDLAWIRLQQSQPELYKPLMYFLDSQSQQTSEKSDDLQQSGQLYFDPSASTSASSSANNKSPRYSESSHRLRKILERHLVANRKIDRRDLNRMDSIQTSGATLRLVDAPHQYQTQQQHQLTASTFNTQPSSAFAALHSIVTGSNSNNLNQINNQHSKLPLKSLKLDSTNANIVQVNEASNGFVYIIDNVLLLPNDADYIVQTSATPAISSTVSSLLGGHNSAILDFLNNLLTPSSANPLNLSANSMLALIGTLLLAITILFVLAVVLIVRKRRQNKLNRHQQLESGLTSSSSANSGSTSTTKSL